MKKTNLILLSLLAIMFTLSSCGDDDTKTEYSFRGTYSSVNVLQNLAVVQQPINLKGENISIDKMFEKQSYAKPITRGELNYNTSNIKITGLTGKGITLEQFNIKINGYTKNFGNINKDTIFSTKDHLDFLNESLNRVVSQQNLKVDTEFTSKDIYETDNIKLTINFDGVFRYMQ